MSASSTSQKALIFLMLVLLGTSGAHADVRVHSLKDLSQDRNVQAIARVSLAIVAGGVVYERCGTQLGITEEQKKSLSDRFTRATNAYVKAYRDAYIKRVGFLPDAQTVNEYTAHIQKEYQQAAANTASAINGSRGCYSSSVRSISHYLEKVEKEEAAQKAAAEAEEE